MTVLSPPASQHFVLENVSWEYYDHTLRQIESAHQHVRVTYDDGRMEMMTMGDVHERIKSAIRRQLIAIRRRKLYAASEVVTVSYIKPPH